MADSGDNKVYETQDEKIIAKIGADKFVEYKNTYPEIENQFFSKVDDLNSDESHQRGANSASANVVQEFSAGAGNASRGMTSSGINPNEGYYKQTVDSGAINSGIARANNVSQTQQALQDNYISGKQAIAAMGQGQEANTIKGFGDIAGASAQKAGRDAITAFNRTNRRNSAIATGAGAITGTVMARQPKPRKQAIDASGVNTFDYSGYA